MSQNRLTKRLRREISANPKKALFLGLLILAALYFWAPLVRGWITQGNSPTTTAIADPRADLPAAAPEKPTTTPPKEAAQGLRHPWEQLVRWMENDPRTSVAGPLPQQPPGKIRQLCLLDIASTTQLALSAQIDCPGFPITCSLMPRLKGLACQTLVLTGPTNLYQQRDPFVTPNTQIVQHNNQDRSKTADPNTTPQSLGMVLSSTIIGPHRRLARISGKTYKLGQTVTLDEDGRRIAFTLVEVHQGQVVMESVPILVSWYPESFTPGIKQHLKVYK